MLVTKVFEVQEITNDKGDHVIKILDDGGMSHVVVECIPGKTPEEAWQKLAEKGYVVMPGSEEAASSE